MNCLKRVTVYTVMVLCMATALSGIAFGQEERDLNNYVCKDVMRMSGNNRDLAIGVLHAFLLGKKGTTQFEVSTLSEATDEFIEYCLDHPNDKALGVMEKMTQKKQDDNISK